MSRWRTVLQYALALFAALFLTGFVEGLLLPAGTTSALGTQSMASSVIALALSMAIFVHLAVHHRERALELAALALVGNFLIGVLAQQVAPSWLLRASAAEVAFEQLLLLAALAIGVPLGVKLRNRQAARAEA